MSNLVCSKCMKSFSRKDNLNRHMKSCKGVDELKDEKDKINKIIEEYYRLQKENEQLKKDNTELKQKLSKYETTENNIVDYADLDYDFLTDKSFIKAMKTACKNKDFGQIVETYIKFMFENPEHKCIKLHKTTSKTIKVMDNNKFVDKPVKDFYNEFISDMFENIDATDELLDIEEISKFLEYYNLSEKRQLEMMKANQDKILCLFL